MSTDPATTSTPLDDTGRVLMPRVRSLRRPWLRIVLGRLTGLKRRSPSPASAATLLVPPPRHADVLAYLDLPSWEHETIAHVFKITLEKDTAENSGWDLVWLKNLAAKLESKDPALQKSVRLVVDNVDRLLIERLQMAAHGIADDLEYLPVLASLPLQQTAFEFLVGCWKRLNATRRATLNKKYLEVQEQRAMIVLDELRSLIIKYIGLTLRDPDTFPQPVGRDIGPLELVPPLLSLSSLCTSIPSVLESSETVLDATDIEPLLKDIVQRFESDNELDKVLGPVVCALLSHESLTRPEGLGGGDPTWRGIIGGLEALVKIRPIAIMITRLPEWNPPLATAASIEKISLMGPLCRLNVFGREWPSIAHNCFSEVGNGSREKFESSTTALRIVLQGLQSSLFRIFNTIVRASPESRDAVLQYFAHVIILNAKRANIQVEPETVATDSFLVNLQIILYRFAGPFMDAKYSKIDRIDPLYFAHSSGLTSKDATSGAVNAWEREDALCSALPPSFISDIFYLTIAISHCGYQRTIRDMDRFAKHVEKIQRHVDRLRGGTDTTWVGAPSQPRTEAAINVAKAELDKMRSQQYSFIVQLLDPGMIFRSMTFTNFVCTWLGRFVDPKKTHPNPVVDLPLPKDVPMAFKALPEFILEDMIDYFLFIVRQSPNSLELLGKNELVIFSLTFLTSTWYIKNPILKAKIVEVLFYGTLGYGHGRAGVLGSVLNTHPVALKHLIPALMNFYVEVEYTGASSPFRVKFHSRKNIACIFKVIQNNPTHRETLNIEAGRAGGFVRFINLMINDVTYLTDESLSELMQIHDIQREMENREEWETRTAQYRRDREATLRQRERLALGYTTLGQSIADLLKFFTAETKALFMMPKIVCRLAAILNHNLDALLGPKCWKLDMENPRKRKFYPIQLLSDMLQVFLNLSSEEDFVRAVADDRSYKKVLFEKAVAIAKKRALKTDAEIAKLTMFLERVEAKGTLETNSNVPDEFLDPLMGTKNPVSTIKDINHGCHSKYRIER